MSGVGFLQTQEHAGEAGLPGAGAPDEPERAARSQRDADLLEAWAGGLGVPKADPARLQDDVSAPARRWFLCAVPASKERGPATGRDEPRPARNTGRVGLEQGSRVRVLSRSQDALRGPRLDDRTGVHHQDAVGDRAHGGKVVANEQHTHPTVAQMTELGDHSGGNRGIQGGGRLVGDEQLRPCTDRGGDERPLPHPPRELPGEPV